METIRPVALGDTFVMTLNDFPDPIDEDDWNGATFRLYGPIGGATSEVNADASLTMDYAAQEAKVRYPTAGGVVQAGAWRWTITLTSETNNYSMTAFDGVVVFTDPQRDTRLTHDQSMITLLETIIANRLAADGRQDVITYAIGDRNLSVEPLSALRMELNQLRERVAYAKGRRRLRA